MATEVKLPIPAEGVDKGDVASVAVKVGDVIADGDTVIELESEKATIPIPSSASGKVTKVLVKAGDNIKVGATLIEVEEAAKVGASAHGPATVAPSATPTPAPAKTAAAPATAPAAPAAVARRNGGPVPAGPTVRRMARELGVDLSLVPGSGRGGRITVEDMDAFIRQHIARQSGGGGGPMFAPVELPDFSKWGPIRTEKIDSLRRKISEKMATAWATVPHVHHSHEADITELVAVQKRYKERVKEKGGALTLTPFLVKAVVIALKEFPRFNATFDAAGGQVIFKDYYNIGVAVDTPAGLVVPVLQNVDQKPIVQLSVELNDLAERTRDRKVGVEELRGGTFTISNLGGIGGGHFNPIVNTPEVAILGVGRAVKKPVFAEDGSVVARMMLPVVLAYDHRIIDGADGARFLVRVVEILENFEATFLGF
ncbi:MAG: 2-oxo acid dehydrogenase subunit E2 [Candidatus Sumerlaeaceae bacterium]|nr:2-oxo acid dehydrogenase subunit E2 [Candidatus Sumerlaeaceae bacterium]